MMKWLSLICFAAALLLAQARYGPGLSKRTFLDLLELRSTERRTLVTRSTTTRQCTTTKPSSCTEEYAAMDTSTMCCFSDDPDITNAKVSKQDIQDILETHNRFRASVSPSATNMVKMYYDENIATVAQKYANACPDGHDRNRRVAGYSMAIGQNLAWGQRDWVAAITAWHSEVEIFQYGEEPKSYMKPGDMIGHYTQVVNNAAILVGCGYADCSGSAEARGRGRVYANPTYVCNYAYGQTGEQMKRPYTSGSSCSECPNHCQNNLCDCGSKVCLNGGTLNLSTCQCDCKPAGLFSGEHCEIVTCPARDPNQCVQYDEQDCKKYRNIPSKCPWKCGLACEGEEAKPDCPEKDGRACGSQWPSEYCYKYSNVPDACPYMCGICESSGSGGSGSGGSGSSGSGSSGSSSGGSNSGGSGGGGNGPSVDCSKHDPFHCGTVWPKPYCDQYSNVIKDCPYMCKVCKGESPPPNCPDSDASFCSYQPDDYCSKYSNIPRDCPYKCGICT